MLRFVASIPLVGLLSLVGCGQSADSSPEATAANVSATCKTIVGLRNGFVDLSITTPEAVRGYMDSAISTANSSGDAELIEAVNGFDVQVRLLTSGSGLTSDFNESIEEVVRVCQTYGVDLPTPK